MKNVYMRAVVEIMLPKKINLEKYPSNVSVGGFAVRTIDGDIPFDFEAGGVSSVEKINDMEYRVHYFSNENPAFCSPDVTDCYDEDYRACRLTRNDITAEYLAKAEELTEFFILCWDEEGKEITPSKVNILDITFEDENHTPYTMADDVLARINSK